MHTTPLSRPVEPPAGPTRRDVLRLWEELEWWSCVYCDIPFGQMVAAEIDHVRPLAYGGVHEWPNLAPACGDCNRSKSDRDVGEWLASSTGQSLTDRASSATQRNIG
ncbi:HNH endonuclease signature motif containing protein [Streptomyces sp. NPDC056291]|uniref:HNH endonuclease signature motif containing protein n=1 Tax=Streptomyces sp. NPDC056291 TaxID=3345772 RepID=UPI0035D84E96